jgi:hypothetical protein
VLVTILVTKTFTGFHGMGDSLEKAQVFFESKEWADLAPDRDKVLKTIRRYSVEAVN